MKTILFVCVENAGRSQMAEGFFNKYALPGYHAVSAGTKPAGRINPFVVQAMNDIGIDINNQKSKIIADEMIRFCQSNQYGLHGQVRLPTPIPQQPRRLGD